MSEVVYIWGRIHEGLGEKVYLGDHSDREMGHRAGEEERTSQERKTGINETV
jgi:hypothetical protein